MKTLIISVLLTTAAFGGVVEEVADLSQAESEPLGPASEFDSSNGVRVEATLATSDREGFRYIGKRIWSTMDRFCSSDMPAE